MECQEHEQLYDDASKQCCELGWYRQCAGTTSALDACAVVYAGEEQRVSIACYLNMVHSTEQSCKQSAVGYNHTSRSYKHDTEAYSQSVLQLQALGDKGWHRLQACCLTGNCHCLH